MNWLKYGLTVLVCISCCAVYGSDDLRAYYEKQKSAVLPMFEAPQLGSQVTIKFKSGESRTGILMKLDAETLTLMSDSGLSRSYARSALHDTSRAQFFAEDYAHALAVEQTRRYKEQRYKENKAELAADVHDGRITVSFKTEKNSEKKIEEKESKNKNSGNTNTSRTHIRTNYEVVKLRISAANVATHPDTFMLKAYFFGERVAKNIKKQKKDGDAVTPGMLSIKNQVQKQITLDSRGRQVIEMESEPYKITKTETENHKGIVSRDPVISGDESAGWLVILMHDSTILDKKASHAAYLSDDWINKYK